MSAVFRKVTASILPVAALLLTGAGCASIMPFPVPTASHARVETLSESPLLLTGRFRTAVYAPRSVETTVLLSDLGVDRLLDGPISNGQFLHVELLWTPRAGHTPIEDSATNTSIRYVIFAEGEVGVYGGAGFARVQGEPGDPTFSLVIRDASLRLLESTDGFRDLLTPARLTGSITARLNEQHARQIQHAVSQHVTNAMGRSRIVYNRPSPCCLDAVCCSGASPLLVTRILR